MQPIGCTPGGRDVAPVAADPPRALTDADAGRVRSPPLPARECVQYHRAMLRYLASVLTLGLLCVSAVATASAADIDAPMLEELVVTGERAGPGMWHVHRGGEELWILGSLTPLPRGLQWRADEVQRRLSSTSVVLVPKPLEIGIVRILWLLITERKVLMLTGGKHLEDVMPPELYARFAQQRALYTRDAGKWEHFRPIVAAALLQQEAFHHAGLSARIDLGAAVRKLAHERHVPLEEVKIAGVGDIMDALKSMPPATENACVVASLATIERDLSRLQARAVAWASGNVERIESLPEPAEVDACLAALDAGAAAGDLPARIRRAWREAMERALHSGKPALAVVNIDLLLEKGGVLDQLRAQGYEVDTPPGAAR